MALSMKQIAAAIRTLHHRIWWKPGSLERHLRTRIKRGHLPENATTKDYEQVIRATISNDEE